MTDEQRQRLEEIKAFVKKLHSDDSAERFLAYQNFSNIGRAMLTELLSLLQEPKLSWKGNELFMGKICVGAVVHFRVARPRHWYCQYVFAHKDGFFQPEYLMELFGDSEPEARAYLEEFVRSQFSGEQITNG